MLLSVEPALTEVRVLKHMTGDNNYFCYLFLSPFSTGYFLVFDVLFEVQSFDEVSLSFEP